MSSTSFFDYPTGDDQSHSSELSLLPEWGNEQWAELIDHTETRRFATGDVIIRAGDSETALYIITTGLLEVILTGRRGRTQRLELITAGSLIGEISFFDGRPRSADVRALTDGEMLRLSFDAFEVFAARTPDLARDLLLDLGRILASRLRTTQELSGA